MFRSIAIPLFLLLPILAAAGAAEGPAAEDAVWVYNLFRGTPTCDELAERLDALPLRPTVILSIEQGHEFILNREGGERQLGCALEHLRRGGRRIKALLLQDPVFLENGKEAVRRAALLGDFVRRHPGWISGAQVDVEPHTVKQWSCCTIEDRRALLRGLHLVLSDVRGQLGGLPLGVVAPWWYPVARDLPEAHPEAFFRVIDEIYLMAYGDRGGPLIGGSAEAVLERIDRPAFFTGRGRLYIGVATYDFRSPEQVNQDLEVIRERLAGRPNFAGTALFHAASPYDLPLRRFVSGTVVDGDGSPVPDAEIRAGGVEGKSGECGSFEMSGFPDERAEMVFRKAGFLERRMSVTLRSPGRIRELGKIRLERDPAVPPAAAAPPVSPAPTCPVDGPEEAPPPSRAGGPARR